MRQSHWLQSFCDDIAVFDRCLRRALTAQVMVFADNVIEDVGQRGFDAGRGRKERFLFELRGRKKPKPARYRRRKQAACFRCDGAIALGKQLTTSNLRRRQHQCRARSYVNANPKYSSHIAGITRHSGPDADQNRRQARTGGGYLQSGAKARVVRAAELKYVRRVGEGDKLLAIQACVYTTIRRRWCATAHRDRRGRLADGRRGDWPHSLSVAAGSAARCDLRRMDGWRRDDER